MSAQLDPQAEFGKLHWYTKWRMERWGHFIKVDSDKWLYICSKCGNPHIDQGRGRTSMGDGLSFYCTATT